MLNPEFKLQYSIRAGWPVEWTNAMRDIARNIWANEYADLDILEPNIAQEAPAPMVRSLRLAVRFV